MRATQRQVAIGLFSVMFLMGGVTLVTPIGSMAQAPPPADNPLQPFAAYEAEMSMQHDMIKTDLTAVETNLEGKIAEVKALVEALAPGAADPLCGAGTEGQRFVPDDVTTPTEYCDNTTGLYWVKEPDSTTRNRAGAVTYCAGLGLDLGNSQTYRLPEVKELISLVDYSQSSPALPDAHPFVNVQSSNYWSATTFANNPSLGWLVFFGNGVVTAFDGSNSFFVWCARSGS